MHLHTYFKYTAHNTSNIIIIKNAIYNLNQGFFVLQHIFTKYVSNVMYEYVPTKRQSRRFYTTIHIIVVR